MADGLAPAIDKVGEPAPGAPEAEAGAPSVPTINEPAAAPQPEETAIEEKKPDIPDGAGPRIAFPKPVEVMSVPETPVNTGTPAGGTPRPELKTFEEPPAEPSVTTGVEAAPITAVSEPVEDAATKPATDDAPAAAAAAVNGKADTESAGALRTEIETDQADETAIAAAEETAAGDKKRKLDDVPAAPAAPAAVDTEDSAESNGGTTNGAAEEPLEKKLKTNGGEPHSSPNGKVAKKDKKPAPAIGKTARKTRSQGPVEV